MATLLRSSNFQAPSLSLSSSFPPLKSFTYSFSVSFKTNSFYSPNTCFFPLSFSSKRLSAPKFFIPSSSHSSSFSAAAGEVTETEEFQQPEILENTDGALGETAEEAVSDDAEPDVDEAPSSPVITALKLYKEALSDNDESKVAELEDFFKSIEEEKDALEKKVASISENLSIERERVLRISADFDNFRKRTDRERLSLVTNAQGEVIENFLPVLDNFERAKSQIKVESDAEEKISNSYQNIYKQFLEIIGSVGVMPVETVGNPFDPLLHEAIMREESSVYEEGVIIEEYRKGFKLGDRLLRPSMVKVSAGPGPEKTEMAESSVQEEGAIEDSKDVIEGVDSKDQTTP